MDPILNSQLLAQLFQTRQHLSVSGHNQACNDFSVSQFLASVDQYLRVFEWPQIRYCRQNNLIGANVKVPGPSFARRGIGRKAFRINAKISNDDLVFCETTFHQLFLDELGNRDHSRRRPGHQLRTESQQPLPPRGSLEDAAVLHLVDDIWYASEPGNPRNRT